MKLKNISGPRSTRLSRAIENMELRRAADRREVARIAEAVANAMTVSERTNGILQNEWVCNPNGVA